MAKPEEVVVNSELTPEKIRELAKYGIIGVLFEPDQVRVFVSNKVGVYLPTEKCGPLFDALDSVGCDVYYGRKVPQSRGVPRLRTAKDVENTRTLYDACGKAEVTMVYIDHELVATVRTVVPLGNSVQYRNCFEAECKLRNEKRTFNKNGIAKILSVRKIN